MQPTYLLATVLAFAPCGVSQEQDTPRRAIAVSYKLTVVQDARNAKRVRKNRVSAEAVVMVTDENDLPVPGIAVTFSIPLFAGGGSSFANLSLTSMGVTDSAGRASSLFVTAGGPNFVMTVTAKVPVGMLSATIPVNPVALAAATGALGAAGGVSTWLVVGIVVGAVAVGSVVAKVATSGNGNPSASSPGGLTATIGGAGGVTLGPPH